MKKTISIIVAIVFALSVIPFIAVNATAHDVYVAAGGSGDGSSESSPLGTMQEALESASAKATSGNTATIHISGALTFEIDLAYNTPVHAGELKITGGSLSISSTGNSIWVMGGPTVFENIALSTNVALGLCTDGWDFTVGEGVSTSGKDFYIFAAGCFSNHKDKYVSNHFDGTKYPDDANITLLSGKFAEVQVFRANAKGPIDGDATLTVGGTAEIVRLSVFRSAPAGSTVKNAKIILDGGKVGLFCSNTDRPAASLKTDMGATQSFRVIITDKFNISGSFGASANDTFSGISGCGAGNYTEETAAQFLSSCDYKLEVADSLYDTVISSGKVQTVTFGGIVKSSGQPVDTPGDQPGEVNPGGGDDPVGGDDNPSGTDPDETSTPIWVKDGGTGDGMTKDSPLGTIQKALSAAAKLNGNVTINVIGTVPFSFGGKVMYASPRHKSNVKFTGGTISFTADENSMWRMGGNVTFENVTFTTDKSFGFITDFYEFTFGDGVKTSGSIYVTVAGTFNGEQYTSAYSSRHFRNGVYSGNAKITLRSGSFAEVEVFRTNALGNISGSAVITIGGTASVGRLVTTRNARFTIDYTTVILDGGKITAFLADTDRQPLHLQQYRGFGTSKTFRVMISKNFDISQSFNNDNTSDTFFGCSGLGAGTFSKAEANELFGDVRYILEVQDGAWNAVNGASDKIQKSTFTTVRRVSNDYAPPTADNLSGAIAATVCAIFASGTVLYITKKKGR
ncbi:MAG: hypothetical protein IJU75_06230 [Clostridia bacterium]|nr:hypothetical protein [Clostridia bacterium]